MEWYRGKPGVPRVRLSGFALPVLLPLAMAATLLLTSCGSGHDLAESLMQKGAPLGAKVGDAAMDFTLPTPDGTEVNLSQFRGQPVVIYFWASWCGTCTFDLPDLADAAEREAGNGLVVISVNIGEKIEFVESYVQDTVGDDYKFLVASDTTLDTFRQYHILSFPTTFFVGRDGVIRSMRVGRISEDILDKGILGIQ